MKKTVTIIWTILLILTLCISCGAKSEQLLVAQSGDSDGMEMRYEMESSDSPALYSDMSNIYGITQEPSMDSSANIQVEIPQGRKIILNAELEMETLEFDKTIQNLNAAIQKTGGYVSDSSQSGSGEGNSRRNYYITARIPTDKYNDFLNATAEAGNIIYKSESSSDVTSQYIDVEARLLTLKQQEERLLALLEQSGDLESLIIIEERLSDVRYEIELFEVQKRTFDDLISYSTVNLSVQEVRIITETNDAFFPQLADSISGSWTNFVSGVQNFIFGFIYALPTLIIWGGIIFGIVIFAKKMRKKRKSNNKKGEKTATTMQSSDVASNASASKLEK